jgi:hypothetical protein
MPSGRANIMITDPSIQPSVVARIHHQAFWRLRFNIIHCRIPRASPMTIKARLGRRNLPKTHAIDVAISHWNHSAQSKGRVFCSAIVE